MLEQQQWQEPPSATSRAAASAGTSEQDYSS